MKFFWNEDYSVGVKLFDEHHRHFFELSNKMDDFSKTDDINEEELLITITEFGNYSLYHMKSEEECLKEYNFDGLKNQVEAHDEYRNKISDFLKNIKGENKNLKKIARDLSDFAESWLLVHILLLDKKYTSFLNNHGFK